MPGEGLTHGPPATKKAGGSHHRFSQINRHSLRNGFNAYTRSPWCAGLDSHHRWRIIFRQLDPSVGGSGPRDFAVRFGALVMCATVASIASRAPRLVTIGHNAPLAEAGRSNTITCF